jgi:hypothetical protein
LVLLFVQVGCFYASVLGGLVVVCLVVEQFVFPQLVGLWVVFGLLLFYNEIHFIFAKKKIM